MGKGEWKWVMEERSYRGKCCEKGVEFEVRVWRGGREILGETADKEGKSVGREECSEEK